jgi:hypothetical protein
MVSDSAGNKDYELTKSQSTVFRIKYDQTSKCWRSIFVEPKLYHPRSNTQTIQHPLWLHAKRPYCMPRAGASNIENIWL